MWNGKMYGSSPLSAKTVNPLLLSVCSAWELHLEEKEKLIYDVMIYTSLLNRFTQPI